MTIVGKNNIYHWENLVGPFLVHKLLDPTPSSNTSPGVGDKTVFTDARRLWFLRRIQDNPQQPPLNQVSLLN